MASMAVYIRCRPRSLLRPSASSSSSSPTHLFSASSSFSSSSSSSSPDHDDGNGKNEAGSSKPFVSLLSHLKQAERAPLHQSPGDGNLPSAGNAQTKSGSSFFADLKFSLKEEGNPVPPPPRRSLSDIRNTLSRFKAPHPDPRSHGHRAAAPLFTEIYKKNVTESDRAKSSNQFSFIKDHLRLSVKQKEGPKSDLGILSSFADSLNDKRSGGKPTMELPAHVFGKELNEKSKRTEDAPENELIKNYSMEELGNKLQMLRPEGLKQGENWFSLSELNQRLIKLKEMDSKNSSTSSDAFAAVKDLVRDGVATSRKTHQQVQILSSMGVTPSYMLEPAKDHLVEKYFHPDNMSSAEKMKLELKKVRDEFKMSETDCGSTRVQIAQLTTEINHLSKVLHKKDKHSIKGLQGKVQMRKKLLKYLRRTDWDSYCFILSKLGLRDNPSYKQH